MDRSLGFGSIICYYTFALFRLGFPSASNLTQFLTSQHMYNSPDRSTKSTVSSLNALYLLVNIGFQVLFHSPPGVLFNFPSRYFFTIGHQVVFSLGRWSGLLPTGFLVSCCTLDSARSSYHFAYEAFTLFGLLSQYNSAMTWSNFLQSSTPYVFLLMVWALPISLATTFGIDFSFFSWGYLDVSVHLVSLLTYYFIHMWIVHFLHVLGSPIQISVGQWIFAPHHSFSQLVTSFFASWYLGIHPTLLLA